MLFLYTNYQNESVRFYDLLENRRVHGSNESEQILTDESDKEFWVNKLNSPAYDVSEMGRNGIRAYRKIG